MLLKYIVKNFKSIGHNIEFSMFPVKSSEDKRYLTTINTKMGKWEVLRRGALFGPNASGKSSFIQSVDFARDYIVEGQKSGRPTGINQFKGKFDDVGDTSTFQFMFYLNGEVYDYGFTIDTQKVHEEWLMVLTKDEFRPMFIRETGQNDITTIDIKSLFARANSKDRNLAEVLKDSLQENQKNQLFLYKLADNGVRKAEIIMEWFSNIQVIFPNSKIKMLPMKVMTDDDLRHYLSDKLNGSDTGVSQLLAKSKEVTFKELAEKMDISDDEVAIIQSKKSGIVEIGRKLFLFSEKNKQTQFIQLKFEHILNDRKVEFNIDDESDGTQRLLDLLPMLFKLSEGNMMYFVDELDRSLHTKLSKHFVSTFAQDSNNSTNQLVFTAHDVNLIALDDMRQDEIWFLEKSNLGETKIKPFSDFTIEKKYDTVKAYLAGRFGAVPNLKEGL